MAEQTKMKQRKVSDKSMSNLKPCKPGETHNPNGRPRGAKSVTTILKERLQEIAPGAVIDIEVLRRYAQGKPIKSVTTADALACVLLNKALDKGGDLAAIKEVLDRTEGKAQQSLEVITDPRVTDLKNKIQQNADRKKIPYEKELELYLATFQNDIAPDIKDKLVSELVQ